MPPGPIPPRQHAAPGCVQRSAGPGGSGGDGLARAAGCAGPGSGAAESAIMTVLWDAREPLTVRDVRDRLDYRVEDGDDPAYTTVMTVTTILWRKELLSRDKFLGKGNQRAWWYQPHVTREDHLAGVIRGALACAPDPAAVLLRALPSPGSPPVCVAQVRVLSGFGVSAAERRDTQVSPGACMRGIDGGFLCGHGGAMACWTRGLSVDGAARDPGGAGAAGWPVP